MVRILNTTSKNKFHNTKKDEIECQTSEAKKRRFCNSKIAYEIGGNAPVIYLDTIGTVDILICR